MALKKQKWPVEGVLGGHLGDKIIGSSFFEKFMIFEVSEKSRGPLGSFVGPWGLRRVWGGVGRFQEGSRGALEGLLESFIFFFLELSLSMVQPNIYIYICFQFVVFL